VAGDPDAAALAAVERTYRPELTLLTLYIGQDVPPARADNLRRRLEERLPDVQVEAVAGGQPHYPYIIALE
jgi:dihydroxyacetone kinase-like predicted kinase